MLFLYIQDVDAKPVTKGEMFFRYKVIANENISLRLAINMTNMTNQLKIYRLAYDWHWNEQIWGAISSIQIALGLPLVDRLIHCLVMSSRLPILCFGVVFYVSIHLIISETGAQNFSLNFLRVTLLSFYFDHNLFWKELNALFPQESLCHQR